MSYTEARKKAIYKYQSDKVKIQIMVSPEQREKYKIAAGSKNMSLSAFIVDLLEKNS